jgi:hypothetical protein
MDSTVVLTDLPNVVPLMQQSVKTWREKQEDATSHTTVEPLAWGTDIGGLEKYGQLSHIICCDLVSRNGRYMTCH